MNNENRIDNLFDEDFLFSEPDLNNPESFVEQVLSDSHEESTPQDEQEVDIEFDNSDKEQDDDVDILEMVDEEEPEIVNIDNEEFKEVELDDDPVETMPDEEFDKILKELRLSIDEDNTKPVPLKEMTAEEKIQTNLDLLRERIKLERDELEYEKEKFTRYKAEYETMKKLSEESFQAEKEEFERRKQIEIKKIYLEAREKISSYKTFEDFIEDYKKNLDVSK